MTWFCCLKNCSIVYEPSAILFVLNYVDGYSLKPVLGRVDFVFDE